MSLSKKQKLLPILLSLITLASPLLFTSHANAQEALISDTQGYVGLDIFYSSISYNQTSSSGSTNQYQQGLSGGNFHVGVRTESLGFEVGLFGSSQTNSSSGGIDKTNSDLLLSGTSFDVLAFLPLDSQKKLEALGSLGFAFAVSSFTAKENTTPPADQSLVTQVEIKPRVKIGFQYRIAPKWTLRTLAQWQDASFTKEEKKINTAGGYYSFGIGFNYDF
jgi:hypothetical protein